jgi:hypothetical protein
VFAFEIGLVFAFVLVLFQNAFAQIPERILL